MLIFVTIPVLQVFINDNNTRIACRNIPGLLLPSDLDVDHPGERDVPSEHLFGAGEDEPSLGRLHGLVVHALWEVPLAGEAHAEHLDGDGLRAGRHGLQHPRRHLAGDVVHLEDSWSQLRCRADGGARLGKMRSVLINLIQQFNDINFQHMN